MNTHALFHEPKSQLGYANTDGSVTLRFRTASNDVKSVTLIHGDKYAWDKQQRTELLKVATDGNFDYYEVTIKPPHNRLAYYFEIHGKRPKTCYYTEWGPATKLNLAEIDLMFFNFPYVNAADIHVVPKWVTSAIFYQIFPERFANGDPSNDPEGVVPWDSQPTRDNHFGGDLKGITDHVPHLVSLGINAIYMTPVFLAPSNHKYNTTDYLQIDPDFGTLDDLKTLVKTCHDHGIKVVLDAVFNHSGFMFKPFQDVLNRGEQSPYKDWFYIHQFPVTTDPLGYETFSFESYMPKLNTDNPEVVNYLIEVAQYWIREADIDGWRLDVANEVDHEFWRNFKRAVRAVKADAYILGEIWHNAKPWLLGDQFDGAMNYPFTRACLNYFAYGTMNTADFKQLIDTTLMRNTAHANSAMLNLLDSHDTPRFLTRCGGNVAKLKLAAIFQMTFVGAPSVYYGTEIGMLGEADPDCRRGMIWDKNQWDTNLFHFYQQLILLRKERPSLYAQQMVWLDGELPQVLAYIKQTSSERTLVLMNNGSEAVKGQISLSGYKLQSLLLGEDRVRMSKHKMTFSLKPYGFSLFDLGVVK